MANSFWNFIKGIRLKGETSNPTDNVEGSLWYNSTDDRFHGYAESGVRELTTNDQTQTLTNKTLTGNTMSSIVNGAGTLNINSSGTVTVPNATDTLVGKATTDTLTNKTLSGNIATNLINGSGTFAFNSTGTITAPNATDTLMGKATTDTMTNKTFDADGTGNSITNIENADIKAAANIARTKLASGSINHVLINDGSGVMSSEATLAKTRGGTGADNSAVTFPSTGVIVTETATETLTNKSLSDSTTAIVDNSDPTKKILFDAAGTTGTTTTLLSSQTTSKTLTLPDATDTLVGKATTDTFTNKSISGSTNTITNVSLTTGVTGVLPIANGGTNANTKTDAFDSLAPTTTTGDTIYHNGTDNIRLGIGAANQVLKVVSGVPAWSTFSGGINYIAANPDAEADTSGWATYADAAGAAPVDGTGGSPNVTWTRTTSSPLRGSASFLFTKDAANRQGQGVSFAFTADSADQAKVLAVNFDYTVASGTYADSDLTVYLYDVTNSLVIQPSGYQILNGTTGLPLKQRAEFQTASNSTSYRLIFHVASTSAVAYTVKVDNVFVGPTTTQIGAFVGDWITFTPTLNNAPLTSATGRWRRVGDTMEINYYYVLSGVATGSVTYNMPSGYTIDATTKLPWSGLGQSGGEVGRGVFYDTSAGQDYELEVWPGTTTFTGRLVAASPTWVGSGANVTATSPVVPASGDAISLTIWGVPIVGWGSGQVLSSDTDTRVVDAILRSSSTTISSTYADIVWTNTDRDSHGAFSSATYTVPVPGDYDLDVSFFIGGTFALNTLTEIQILKNGSQAGYSPVYSGGAVTGQLITLSKVLALVAGDTLKVQLRTTATGPSINGSTFVNNWGIRRRSGPSQIAASETVAARYTTTAGQSIPNATTTIVDYGTKDFDTHNAVTTGASWKFTAPIPGKYMVSGGGAHGPASWTATQLIFFEVDKNGSVHSNLVQTRIQTTGSNNYRMYGGGVIVNCIAGDTIDIRTFQNQGGAVSMQTSAGDNWVAIVRVGN